MTVIKMGVNDMQHTNAAPLRNLGILDNLLMRAENRAEHLPGIVTFSGPSGFGKSTAAAYASAKHMAYYLEVRSTWTKKAFLEAVLQQIGIEPMKTVYQQMDQVSEELACSQRPIILDEFDNAVDRNLVELVRDLYEQSKASFVLIGEERLPQKLQKWERFHGRIMEFSQAQPADLNDAKTLVNHYTPGLEIEEDLLAHLVDIARGSVRRIVTNLDLIQKFARGEGLQKICRAEWGQRPLHESQAPATRRF